MSTLPRRVAVQKRSRFIAYFHFVGWHCLSFGLHVDWLSPNVEIHVPLGFFRIGWETISSLDPGYWKGKFTFGHTAGHPDTWPPLGQPRVDAP